jgi:hypothetical protein
MRDICQLNRQASLEASRLEVPSFAGSGSAEQKIKAE